MYQGPWVFPAEVQIDAAVVANADLQNNTAKELLRNPNQVSRKILSVAATSFKEFFGHLKLDTMMDDPFSWNRAIWDGILDSRLQEGKENIPCSQYTTASKVADN